METAREVIEQIFGELKASMKPDERLIVEMLPGGHLCADLISMRDDGLVAVNLGHVINVLANRMERGGNYAKKIE